MLPGIAFPETGVGVSVAVRVGVAVAALVGVGVAVAALVGVGVTVGEEVGVASFNTYIVVSHMEYPWPVVLLVPYILTYR